MMILKKKNEETRTKPVPAAFSSHGPPRPITGIALLFYECQMKSRGTEPVSLW
jgi:hypothetical protein